MCVVHGAQLSQTTAAPLVGNVAPDFTAQAVFDQEFQEISLSSYRGKCVPGPRQPSRSRVVSLLAHQSANCGPLLQVCGFVLLSLGLHLRLPDWCDAHP